VVLVSRPRRTVGHRCPENRDLRPDVRSTGGELSEPVKLLSRDQRRERLVTGGRRGRPCIVHNRQVQSGLAIYTCVGDGTSRVPSRTPLFFDMTLKPVVYLTECHLLTDLHPCEAVAAHFTDPRGAQGGRFYAFRRSTHPEWVRSASSRGAAVAPPSPVPTRSTDPEWVRSANGRDRIANSSIFSSKNEPEAGREGIRS